MGIGSSFASFSRSPLCRRLRKWLSLPAMPSLDQSQQSWRIFVFERNIGLAVKAVVLSTLFYFFYWSSWKLELPVSPDLAPESGIWFYAQRVAQYGFMGYVAMNIGAAFILLGMDEVPRYLVLWTVFTIALVDGLFLACLVVITGGLSSPLYWLFLLLVVRNCVAITNIVPQIGLNLLMCAFFTVAVIVEINIAQMDDAAQRKGSQPELGEIALLRELGAPFALRIALMLGLASWCYGFQVVLDRQRRRVEEQNELVLRRNQLEASGRLAAEIAHQLKNPLAIINNASFTLQKTVKEGKTITQQIRIIREEVARSDRLITELMGYSKLTEGRVERLNVREELEQALVQVFPPALKYEVEIHRDYATGLPALLAQRTHLQEVFVNLLQNAREAMSGKGNLWVSAQHGEDFSVVVKITDDGPGIDPKLLGEVFEPYVTTREKGTGLGLAIVKHNTEMYGGKVSIESELGKGTAFILEFPSRTLVRLRK